MEKYAAYQEGQSVGARGYAQAGGGQSQRIKVFAIVLGLCLGVGFAALLLLSPIYRSSATLLISAPVAIDQESGDADVQQVAIQREILLSEQLLSLTSQRIAESTGKAARSVEDLQLMLRAEPVEETNLMDLAAEGAEQEFLPVLVGHWVQEYLDMRADDVRRNVQQTKVSIEQELDQISKKVQAARAALNAYREEHNIVSAEREENEALSRLRGLNASLNTAMEAEVKARSQLQEAQAAGNQGKLLIAPSQVDYVNDLQNRLSAQRARLAVLEQRYTRDYINLKPELREIPEEVEALEEELRRIKATGSGRALQEAQQEYERAQRVAENLREEFAARKAEAREITAVFAEHEALVTDLAELEQLSRDTQTRLAQLDARQFDRQAQVSVIAEASSATRIWPDYGRLSLYIAGGSLAVAIFCVWLMSWLQGRRDQGAITLTGVHIYPNSPGEALSYERAIRDSLEHRGEQSLEDQSLEDQSRKPSE
ncbi:GumC family protein [Pseudomaricurvus sp.]|uniref:GumC family protein n=1 Tax=Pseudomaricurvus sp. TaxID=2004510 RepID=UPI003F6ACC85